MDIGQKRKITSKFIVTDDSLESRSQLIKWNKKYSNLKIKLLKGLYLAAIIIAEDKMMILDFEELNVIVIKNLSVATQFRFFYESLWQISKEF